MKPWKTHYHLTPKNHAVILIGNLMRLPGQAKKQAKKVGKQCESLPVHKSIVQN